MANSLSASLRENWSRDYQMLAEKVNVFSNICNYRLEEILSKGQQAHRPYMSDVVVNTLGSEGSYTRQDISSTDEYLTVDQEKEASFYIKDIDHWQSHYPTREKQAKRCAVKLMNQVDGDVLGEYDQATLSLSDGDFGGTTGNGITLTTSNVASIFTKAGRKLGVADAEADEQRWAVISEQFYETLLERLEGKESMLGDSVAKNGHVGRYMGFELYKSNAVGASYQLVLATNPTADDTITINGVTLTFKASPAAAGEIDIAADADATRVLLETFINAGGATSSAGSYVALSAANQKLWKNITAVNDATANTLTLKVEGKGSIAVSETLTAAADVWTTGLQIQHLIFGQGKPVDLVVQKYPKMQLKDRDGYIGSDVVNYLVYGKKTFTDGARKMVDVKIAASAF